MSHPGIDHLRAQHPLLQSNQPVDQVIGMGNDRYDACGIYTPYARCSADGFFHKLTDEGSPIWHDPEKAEEMEGSGDLILLNMPVPLPPPDKVPRILLVTEEFLHLIDMDKDELPAKIGNWPCTWTTLKDTTPLTMATCAPKKKAEQWLDKCARIIMTKYDATIRQSDKIDRPTLFRWADIALTAAADPDLSQQLHLRYCAMQAPADAKRTFTTFPGIFPDMKWEEFERLMKSLVTTIRSSFSD